MIQKIVALTQYCSAIFKQNWCGNFYQKLEIATLFNLCMKTYGKKNSFAAEFKTFALSRKKWTRNVSHLNVPFKAK